MAWDVESKSLCEVREQIQMIDEARAGSISFLGNSISCTDCFWVRFNIQWKETRNSKMRDIHGQE